MLGIGNGVASIPDPSEPCMRLSPHTAPSLIVPFLGIQLLLGAWVMPEACPLPPAFVKINQSEA
ncbi:MAG: hypothetical protein DWQ54_12935 [Microcystis flos-aquae TF09]|uniref:Uncharacterized protein n=1 Tax=Microcystis flos-aquae TF09 TaxID=2060473 RepID=A0A3E0L3X7_9CHRO|nr:MAG: hypothetical protein DWQ54_12935 [Microcystis flos-aquae TF09]